MYLALLRGQSVALRTRTHSKPYKRTAGSPALRAFAAQKNRIRDGFELLLRLPEMGAVLAKSAARIF